VNSPILARRSSLSAGLALTCWLLASFPAVRLAAQEAKNQQPPAPAPAPPGAPPASVATPPAGAPATSTGAAAVASAGDVQLSFAGANVDLVVKWLAEVTGKSIVKHKGVNCQLTILSSKKLPLKEAIGLVYRALALEGFSAVETGEFIILLPENLEPKVGAEMMNAANEKLLEGKQVVVKIFQLQNTTAAKLRDKVRGVLSEKAKFDMDEAANKLIVTDFADNVRLLGELIHELDVATSSDTVTEIFALRHADAEDLSRLIGAVFGESGAKGGAPAAPPRAEGPPQPGPQPSPGGAGPVGSAPTRILADRTSNRLIVTADRKKMPEIKALIESLDTDRPADVGVRDIPLKHVSAKDLVQEIMPLYAKLRGTSLKDTVEITANSRSNRLIVLSSEASYQAIRRLVEGLDTEEAQEKVIKVFSLENADAEDIAQQLTKLYQGSQDEDYYGYYYYRRYGDSESSKAARFVADRRRNTIIAIAPAPSLPKIGEMIKSLDEKVEGENIAPRIYQLKFVSAVDLEDVLNELLLKKTQRRSYYFYDDYYGSDNIDRNVGRLYGKVRITSEQYSNSLIVTANSAESFEAVEAVIKKLDMPGEAGDTTVNIPLKFAKAVPLSNSLNILYAQGGAPPRRGGAPQGDQRAQGQNRQGNAGQTTPGSFELEDVIEEESYFPWLGGQQDTIRTSDGRVTQRRVSDLVGKVRAVPDARTNSILITTNAHFFPAILKTVNELDMPTPQVLIEARIIEISSDLRDRLGVRWSPDGSQVFDTEDLDNSIMGNAAVDYRDVFAGTALADSMRTGILNASASLDFLIQFLRKNTNSRVRSEPRINVADNEKAKLFVGSRIPFISGSFNSPEGGRTDTFDYIDVGIILEVTPHINQNGDVALKIRVEASQTRPGETLFGGAIIDTRNYKTDLLARSGQTLVLGGIIQREESEVERKIPFLGSIPIIGWFFKKKDKVARDVELMVFLRTTVTRNQEEVDRMMEDERKKTPQIQQWDTVPEPPPEKKAEETARK